MSSERCGLNIGRWLSLAVLIMTGLMISHCAMKSRLLTIATCQIRKGITESSENCEVTVVMTSIVKK